MALRSGYKGFKKLINGLKVLRPGVLGIDIGSGLSIGQDGKLNVTGVDVTVAGNPEEEATAGDLTKLQIGDDIFNVPDTTYSNATTTEAGLMSATDKVKLNGLDKNNYFLRSEQDILCAKNLLFAFTPADSKTTDNATFTVDSDGVVEVSTSDEGTGVRTLEKTIDLTFPVDVILNGCPADGGLTSYQLDVNAGAYADTGSGVTIPANTNITKVRIRVAAAYDDSNAIEIKPMIRLASDPDDAYVPYAMTNSELTDMVQISGVIPTTSDDIDLTHTESTTTITPNIGRTFILKMGKLRILSFYIAGVSIASGAWKELFRTSVLPNMSGASANSYEICGVCAIYESLKSIPLRIAHDGKVSIISSENLSNATVSGILVYLAN